MQKLKKSLENNILKLSFSRSEPFFSIENTLRNKIVNKSEDHSLTTLKACFSKQISFFNLLNVSKLKYPLIKNTFKNQESLTEYLKAVERENRKNDVIVTRVNNNIFKNNSYSIITNSNSYFTFFQLKSKTFPLLKVLKVLKLQLAKEI